MANTYKIPMKRIVIAGLLLFVVTVTAAVTWSFRSGLTWTAICLIVVAAPLSCLYWYMLYVNPRRGAITVAEEGILLSAPPFASAVIPWASVRKVFPVNLVEDKPFSVKKTVKLMHFAGYRCGIVEVESGKEAVMVANRPDVFCIETDDRYYLLGPSDLEDFIADVEANFKS